MTGPLCVSAAHALLLLRSGRHALFSNCTRLVAPVLWELVRVSSPERDWPGLRPELPRGEYWHSDLSLFSFVRRGGSPHSFVLPRHWFVLSVSGFGESWGGVWSSGVRRVLWKELWETCKTRVSNASVVSSLFEALLLFPTDYLPFLLTHSINLIHMAACCVGVCGVHVFAVVYVWSKSLPLPVRRPSISGACVWGGRRSNCNCSEISLDGGEKGEGERDAMLLHHLLPSLSLSSVLIFLLPARQTRTIAARPAKTPGK